MPERRLAVLSKPDGSCHVLVDKELAVRKRCRLTNAQIVHRVYLMFKNGVGQPWLELNRDWLILLQKVRQLLQTMHSHTGYPSERARRLRCKSLLSVILRIRGAVSFLAHAIAGLRVGIVIVDRRRVFFFPTARLSLGTAPPRPALAHGALASRNSWRRSAKGGAGPCCRWWPPA